MIALSLSPPQNKNPKTKQGTNQQTKKTQTVPKGKKIAQKKSNQTQKNHQQPNLNISLAYNEGEVTMKVMFTYKGEVLQ